MSSNLTRQLAQANQSSPELNRATGTASTTFDEAQRLLSAVRDNRNTSDQPNLNDFTYGDVNAETHRLLDEAAPTAAPAGEFQIGNTSGDIFAGDSNLINSASARPSLQEQASTFAGAQPAKWSATDAATDNSQLTNPFAKAMQQAGGTYSKPTEQPFRLNDAQTSPDSSPTSAAEIDSNPEASTTAQTQAQINEAQKTASESATAEKLKALREQFQQAEAQRSTLEVTREQQASTEVDSINTELGKQLRQLKEINASFAAEVLRSMADGVVRSVYGKVSQAKLLKHVGDINSSHTALELYMERQERKAKMQKQGKGGAESGLTGADKTEKIHRKLEDLDSNVNNGA